MTPRLTVRKRHAMTHRDVLGRLGRGVLWLAVLFVVLRGVAGIVATPPQVTSARRAAPALVWPDDAARAFAAEFAAAYLRVDPAEDAAASRAALAAFAAPRDRRPAPTAARCRRGPPAGALGQPGGCDSCGPWACADHGRGRSRAR